MPAGVPGPMRVISSFCSALIILRGKGESAFIAGMSLKQNSTASPCAPWRYGVHDGTQKMSFSSHSKRLPPTSDQPRPVATW